MIEFDPAARITVFDYAGLKTYIAGMFEVRVRGESRRFEIVP